MSRESCKSLCDAAIDLPVTSQIREHVEEHLRMLEGAPGIMMQEVPPDILTNNIVLDEDEPDVRVSQR